MMLSFEIQSSSLKKEGVVHHRYICPGTQAFKFNNSVPTVDLNQRRYHSIQVHPRVHCRWYKSQSRYCSSSLPFLFPITADKIFKFNVFMSSYNCDQGFDFPEMHILDLLALASFSRMVILPAFTTAAFCDRYGPGTAAVGGRFKLIATCRRWALTRFKKRNKEFN